MLTRRIMTAVTAALPLLWYHGMGRNAWAQPVPPAVTLVKNVSDQLVAIVNAMNSADDKQRQLRQVIDASVDIENVAQFCLGRFWRTATPDQRQRYVTRFRDLLVAEIAGHLGEYRGVEVAMGPARTSGETQIVKTTVARPESPTKRVDWVVSTSTGSPKIVDLLAEGISLRLTHSADFASYLSRHQNDVHELIAAMSLQIPQGK